MDKLAGFSRLYIYTLKLKLYTRENDAHSGVIAATHTHTHTCFMDTHTVCDILDCKLPSHGGEFWQSAYNNFHKTGPNTIYTLFSFLSACFIVPHSLRKHSRIT